jgi:hypothetical protein
MHGRNAPRDEGPELTTELIEHPLPTTATVKRMYATAFRCGHPKCKKPLYRMNDVTGDLTLNSTVAHIHARREGGPRWETGMSAHDNRSEANLILLCLEHSREVDDVPDDYPADNMRSWKLTVRAEYDKFHRSWDLTDDQVAEVFAASFEVREFARTTVESESLTQTQRLGGALIEHARTARRPVQAIAAAWVALCDRYTRQMRAWDDEGNVVRVYPPGIEKQKFEREMIAALTEIQAVLEPLVHALVAELRALRSTNVELGTRCDWVEREARGLLLRGTTAALDEAPPVETDGLSNALDALAAAWRGDTAAEPPSVPVPIVDPEPDPAVKARAAHVAVVAEAAPWSRVTTREYNADLYDRLVEQLPYAALLPGTVSNLGLELVGVAGSASAVARNADAEVLKARVEQAAQLEPLAVAIALLNNLATVAKESGRTDIQALAEELETKRLMGENWADPNAWEANLLQSRRLLDMTAARSSEEHVKELVTTSIASITPLTILIVLANWRESLEVLGPRIPGRPDPTIRTIPNWLPLKAARDLVLNAWSDLTAADLDSDDVERRLAAELLKLLDVLE